MKGNGFGSRYIRTLDEALETVSGSGASRIRHISYGTVIYTPPLDGKGEDITTIDFGSEIASDKKLVCPRILLVSTWTDSKLGFPGGGKEGKESPVETMNREFQEEMGTFMNFNVAEDYCFSYMEVVNPNDVRLLNIFCRMTSNLVEFNALLINFPSETRKAYIEEVFTAVGLPLFVEGPEDVNECSPNAVQGLPRYINCQGGIFSRRSNQKIYIVREQFLLVLLVRKVISQSLMRRIFLLGSVFDDSIDSKGEYSWPPMGTLEEFLARPGVSELLL